MEHDFGTDVLPTGVPEFNRVLRAMVDVTKDLEAPWRRDSRKTLGGSDLCLDIEAKEGAR